MELTDIQIKLKERLSLGLNYGLQSLEEALANTSLLKDEIITFKSQYNDLNKIASQGILGYEQVEIGYNKIRQGLLSMIDKITATDLINQNKLPGVQNTELQNRKENFFELLKIHFNNLESVTVTLQTWTGDQYKEDIRKGREAVTYLCKQIFYYNFKHPRPSVEVGTIEEYARDWFEIRYPRMEAYMNTLCFILRYISEEEVDQAFFYGTVKAVLSTTEKIMMIYYAIAGLNADFKKILNESGIIEGNLRSKLIEQKHFDLL
ncbi:MAG: hypothetical protein AAFZ15_13360 [Bacteroidota bacterium]